MGDTGELQSLLAHRAYTAMHRGDFDLAERLFAKASAFFERQRRYGDLAVCEQAWAFFAGQRGDSTGADDLMTASLARFEHIGSSIAAADTMLLGAQHAYDRGDITEMKRLAQEARDVYQAREVHERCAQVDLMLARTLEDNLNRTHHGAHERMSVDNALSLALPAALALEAARCGFATAHARSQWLELADDAMVARPLRSGPWPPGSVPAGQPVNTFPSSPVKRDERGGRPVKESQLDTCVIGAGPAGLAVARALAERSLPYTHLERHTGSGGIWDIDSPGSPMYESAHFISSRTLSGFGGFPMPDHFADYPPHRQVLSYLRSFADAYGLSDRIEFGVEVENVEKNADGTWTVTRSDGRQSVHGQVVVCTGSQWHPNIPELPGEFSGEVRHTVGYRSAEELRGKRVLVVGAGNSGCDIACDAARSADHAVISMRRGYWFIPKHLFGRPVDTIANSGPHLPMWLAQRVFGALLRIINGDPTRLGLPKPDHKLFETHPAINSMLIHHLQHGDITAKPGIARTEGGTVYFTDGTSDDFDLVLLATGYVHKVPVAQRYFGDEQHPDLYLSSFSREHEGLFGIGFVETNAGAYQLFDMQAQLIAGYLHDVRHQRPNAERFAQRIRADRPDLSGGLKLVDSPRHTGYVDSGAFVKYLGKVAGEMGWRTEGRPPSVRSLRPAEATA